MNGLLDLSLPRPFIHPDHFVTGISGNHNGQCLPSPDFRLSITDFEFQHHRYCLRLSRTAFSSPNALGDNPEEWQGASPLKTSLDLDTSQGPFAEP